MVKNSIPWLYLHTLADDITIARWQWCQSLSNYLTLFFVICAYSLCFILVISVLPCFVFPHPVKFPACVIARPALMCCTYVSLSPLPLSALVSAPSCCQIVFAPEWEFYFFLESCSVYSPFFDHPFLPTELDTFAYVTAGMCTDWSLTQLYLNFLPLSESALWVLFSTWQALISGLFCLVKSICF